MTDKLLVLVDGSSYLYRAFHALPALTNSKGQPTGAMHGVISMLRRLRQDFPTEHFAVVFDPRGSTLRNEWYADYKANRPSMPEELAAQIEPLYDIIRALGYPLLQVAGVEADDVLGTLAQQAANQGMKVVISTGDKDLAQLVDDHVSLINTMDNSRLDIDGVVKKFGVRPDQIIDYLTLVGDTVDNIPGVPKVGPKTAVKWIDQYGSLDAIMENADAIKGKVGENLRGVLDQLPLSRRLVTILRDIEVDTAPDEIKVGAVDEQRLLELYTHFEFNTWLKEMEAEGIVAERSAAVAEAEFETILDMKSLDAWIRKLKAADLFAFDTETTSLDYMEAELVGMSFSCEPGSAAYLPLAHDYVGAPQQIALDKALKKLRPLLEDPELSKVGHNLKYDRSVLLNYDIELRGIAFDTMLESYVNNSTASRHDFDSVALNYLGHHTIHYEDVAGKGARQIGFAEVPLEQAAPYAAEDAEVALRLHEHLLPELRRNGRLMEVYESIEMPLVPVLSDVERRGRLR